VSSSACSQPSAVSALQLPQPLSQRPTLHSSAAHAAVALSSSHGSHVSSEPQPLAGSSSGAQLPSQSFSFALQPSSPAAPAFPLVPALPPVALEPPLPPELVPAVPATMLPAVPAVPPLVVPPELLVPPEPPPVVSSPLPSSLVTANLPKSFVHEPAIANGTSKARNVRAALIRNSPARESSGSRD
jgi:hypothetical protein